MTTHDGTYQRLTVAEAAAALGVSRMTVRRMIQRGQLEAERVHRPQGSVYVVTLPENGTGQGTPTAQVPRHRARPNGTGQGTPTAQMVAWSEAFLAPLISELAASRETIRAQAEQLGALRAENAALMAAHSPGAWRQAPWWLWGGVGAVSAGVVVLISLSVF